VLFAIPLQFARADWRFGAESGSLYDSNLSNSERASDEKPDWAWKSGAQVGNGLQLSRDLRLNLEADLRSLVWGRYDGFDQIGSGVSAGLRYRFGLGRQAPWITLENRIGYDHFRENFRSSWDESLGLRAGIGLSERLALECGYLFENIAAPGDFFDQQSNQVDGRIIFDLTAALQISLGYSYRNGDVISYAVPPRPDLFAIARVRPQVSTFGTNPYYNAYRFRGETHAVTVVAGYTIRKYLAIEVAYEYAATSHDPLQYENHLVEAKITFAY
jgi:hypothetical protein